MLLCLYVLLFVASAMQADVMIGEKEISLFTLMNRGYYEHRLEKLSKGECKNDECTVNVFVEDLVLIYDGSDVEIDLRIPHNVNIFVNRFITTVKSDLYFDLQEKTDGKLIFFKPVY